MTDADSQGPPDVCPFCGGDVIDGALGYICDTCDRRILQIDTRDGSVATQTEPVDADGGDDSPEPGGDDSD